MSVHISELSHLFILSSSCIESLYLDTIHFNSFSLPNLFSTKKLRLFLDLN